MVHPSIRKHKTEKKKFLKIKQPKVAILPFSDIILIDNGSMADSFWFLIYNNVVKMADSSKNGQFHGIGHFKISTHRWPSKR